MFRVDAAPQRSPADPATDRLAVAPSQTLMLAAASTDPAAAPMKRRRRVDIDKRPGPVLHLVHPAPARLAPAPTEAPRPETLLAQLARIGQVLREIERAQSFQFIDPHVVQHWQRLSQAADALREDIKDQML